jgi:hypothetical protein
MREGVAGVGQRGGEVSRNKDALRPIRRSGVGGWAYYYPLARTVMGGLLSSTVLTLVVLPYISYGIESLALRFRRMWAASAPRRIAPASAVAPTTSEAAG